MIIPIIHIFAGILILLVGPVCIVYVENHPLKTHSDILYLAAINLLGLAFSIGGMMAVVAGVILIIFF